MYCYLDYHNEVGTISLIQEARRLGKKVAVPRVEGGEMRFYYIASLTCANGEAVLKKGYKGILEPKS